MRVIDLSDGTFIGEAVTDPTLGQVTVKTCTRAGPFLLTLEGKTGAKYFDEGLNQLADFGPGQTLHALVDKWDEHVGVSPLTEAAYRYALNNFKANKRGRVSLVLFLILFVLTLFAELLANDKPIVAVYKGELLFPVAVNYPESKFGGFLAITDYRDPEISKEIEGNGWMLWPPIRYAASTINKDFPRFKNSDGICLGFPAAPYWASRGEM